MANGLIFVVSGPSGVGKSTLLKRVIATDPRLWFSVSMTTRRPRRGERHGVHYLFVDEATFRDAVARGELIEHAEVHGCGYGTPRAPLEQALRNGRDACLDIDVQGAAQVRAGGLGAIFIMIVPPSLGVLEHRLRARGTEDPERLARRLDTARRELAELDRFDYRVVNDDLAVATRQLRAIISAERCRIRHDSV